MRLNITNLTFLKCGFLEEREVSSRKAGNPCQTERKKGEGKERARETRQKKKGPVRGNSSSPRRIKQDRNCLEVKKEARVEGARTSRARAGRGS